MLASTPVIPTGAVFDIFLLFHVSCVLLALISVVVCGVEAVRLSKFFVGNEGREPSESTLSQSDLPESLVRYYEPNMNILGRTIWGVPVFGVILLAVSQGYFSFKDTWVWIGILGFLIIAGLMESILWPTERKVKALLDTSGERSKRSESSNVHTTPLHEGVGHSAGVGTSVKSLDSKQLISYSRRLIRTSVMVAFFIVATMVVMFVQPGSNPHS